MTVTDPETYRHYVERAAAAVQHHGATFQVRGGRREAVEGEARPRDGVLEFASFEAARAYDNSPEHQAADAVRKPAGIGEPVLVEGL